MSWWEVIEGPSSGQLRFAALNWWLELNFQKGYLSGGISTSSHSLPDMSPHVRYFWSPQKNKKRSISQKIFLTPSPPPKKMKCIKKDMPMPVLHTAPALSHFAAFFLGNPKIYLFSYFAKTYFPPETPREVCFFVSPGNWDKVPNFYVFDNVLTPHHCPYFLISVYILLFMISYFLLFLISVYFLFFMGIVYFLSFMISVCLLLLFIVHGLCIFSVHFLCIFSVVHALCIFSCCSG